MLPRYVRNNVKQGCPVNCRSDGASELRLICSDRMDAGPALFLCGHDEQEAFDAFRRISDSIFPQLDHGFIMRQHVFSGLPTGFKSIGLRRKGIIISRKAETSLPRSIPIPGTGRLPLLPNIACHFLKPPSLEGRDMSCMVTGPYTN